MILKHFIIFWIVIITICIVLGIYKEVLIL